MKPLNQWSVQDIRGVIQGIDRKAWIKIGAGVTGAVVFLVFIFWPAWMLRPGVRRQVRELEDKIRVMETLTVRRPVLFKTKEDSLKVIQAAKEQLFQPGGTTLLLGSISQLADESKVKIIASSPKDVVEKFPEPFDTQYEGSLYEFTVEGGYHDIGLFVSKIESQAKLLRIHSFYLRPNKESENAVAHLADLGISAVSLKEATTT